MQGGNESYQAGPGRPGSRQPMGRTLERLLRETSGQDLAEYGVALAVVAGAVAVTAAAIAVGTNTLWTRALQAIVVAVIGG